MKVSIPASLPVRVVCSTKLQFLIRSLCFSPAWYILCNIKLAELFLLHKIRPDEYLWFQERFWIANFHLNGLFLVYILHPKFDDSVFQDSVMKNLLWQLDAKCKVSQKKIPDKNYLYIFCFIDQKDASKGDGHILITIAWKKKDIKWFGNHFTEVWHKCIKSWKKIKSYAAQVITNW